MQSAKAQLREFLLAQSGRGAASSDVTDAALRALDAVFSRDAAARQRQLEEGERQLRERLAAVEAKEVPLRTPSFLGREALRTRVASLAVPLTSPGCATRARCWTLQAAVRSQSAAIALERQRFDALTDSVRDLQLLRQRLGQQLVIGTAAAGNAALSEAIFRHLAGQEGAVSVRVGVPHRLLPRSSLHFRTQCLPLWCCSCKRAWGVLARPRLGPCLPPWQRMRSRHSSCRCQVQGSALCVLALGGGPRVDPP
jgi:hypothetical protein